jgi:hypothetical protein
MPSASWQEEARNAVKKWPRGFRASLDTEVWRLSGAPEDVQQEFRHWAQRIHFELRFPSAETDAVTSLLYRLKENGHHVRSTRDRKKARIGSRKVESNCERATIYPLRSALTKYLSDGSCVRPEAEPTSVVPSRDSGQAAAARKNRVRQARLSIIVALRRLGQPCAKWPSLIREFNEHLGQDPENYQAISPTPFQPPDFDRLNQSPRDWIDEADRAWQKHRDDFLGKCQFWATVGVDDEIPAAKSARGPGSPALTSVRGQNTDMERRYEWAAQYVCRVPLKEIAGQSSAEQSKVGRIARKILRQAEWLRMAQTTRQPSGTTYHGQLAAKRRR